MSKAPAHTESMLHEARLQVIDGVPASMGAIVSDSRMYNEWLTTARANGLRFSDLKLAGGWRGTDGELASAVIIVKVVDGAVRSDTDSDQTFSWAVELRPKPEERAALVITVIDENNEANNERYLVTASSGKMRGNAPLSPDVSSYRRAREIIDKHLGQGRLKDYITAYEPPRRLFSSPGGTTNQVAVSKTHVTLPCRDVTQLRDALRDAGLSLDPALLVAANTDDMATFAQALDELNPTEAERAVSAHNKRNRDNLEQSQIPEVVPPGFFIFSDAASRLSSDDLRAFRRDPTIRQLYADLVKAGCVRAEIGWADMVGSEDTRRPFLAC